MKCTGIVISIMMVAYEFSEEANLEFSYKTGMKIRILRTALKPDVESFIEIGENHVQFKDLSRKLRVRDIISVEFDEVARKIWTRPALDGVLSSKEKTVEFIRDNDAVIEIIGQYTGI